MKVLSINAGSSSLKFSLYKMPEEEMIINGYIQKIGQSDSFYYIKIDGKKNFFEKEIKDHDAAVLVIIDELKNFNIIKDISEISKVGHRVVHGGEEYSESVIINDHVLETIDKLSSLAPLHNPANLVGIKAFKHIIPTAINVAVFDTAFHQTMPKESYMYSLPYNWYTDYGVRKYGFHGTSHRYVYNRISKILNQKDLKVISCHLGNGGSLCAIDKGKSIDTTMGLTPLAGIPMGTRCGDIDPAIIGFMMKKANKSIDEIMEDLNKNSGFVGVGGVGSDNRDVENAIAKGNERAILTRQLYTRKIADYISSYNSLLEGADVICFTGGIGENAPKVRKQIIDRLKPLQIILNEEENNKRHETASGEPCITSPESKIKVNIIETDEELIIARDAFNITDMKEVNNVQTNI